MKHRPTSRRRRTTKSVLRLLDLEHAKSAVLNSLSSPDAQRDIATRSMNSLTGIAQNRVWRSIELLFCAIGLIWNLVNSPQGLSIYVWVLCAVWRMKQLIAVF